MRRFTYVKPRTVPEAVRAMADGGPETRFLAGGTTLYDLMKLDVERPATVVDLTGLRGLRSFDTGGRRELVFGALAPMSDVAADRRLVRRGPWQRWGVGWAVPMASRSGRRRSTDASSSRLGPVRWFRPGRASSRVWPMPG